MPLSRPIRAASLLTTCAAATAATAAVAVIVVGSSSTARGQVIKPLPPPTGSASTYAQSIDAAGNVVGYHQDKPMLWRPSGGAYVAEPLGLPVGASWGGANSIAPTSGVIAGYTQPQDQSTATATVWTSPPASMHSPTLLPAPPTAALTDAYSVNAAGEAAGYFETAAGNTGAVVWTPTGAGGAYAGNVLPKLAGWTDTAATAINSAGHLAGYAFGHPLDIFHAAVWEKTGPGAYAAKNVLSADSALVTAMNDYGTGAGVYAGDQPMVMVQYEGDYYAGELEAPFGTSDGATNAVNNHDALVGYLQDPTTPQSGHEAALWFPNDTGWTLVNLDQWLNDTAGSLGSQWTLNEAFGISDNWLVTGHGVFGAFQTERAFVLDVSSLVPEPAAVMGLAAAGAVMLRRRRNAR